MKIAESQVNLSSQHSLIEQESRQETLRLQNSGALGQTTGVDSDPAGPGRYLRRSPEPLVGPDTERQ